MYPDSELQRIMIVHEGLFVVLCNGDNTRNTQAYFVSRKTQRVIHTLTGGFFKHIVIKPAAIWILQSDLSTIRFSPRHDKAVKEFFQSESGTAENLLWAAYRGDTASMVSLLQAKRININNVENFPFEETNSPFYEIKKIIIASGKIDSLAALLKYDPSIAADSDLLRRTVDAGRIDMVQMLLAHKADPADYHSSILRTAIASRNGTREMVELLLDSGAKVEDAERGENYRLHNSANEWTPKAVYDFFVESGMKVPPTPEAQDTPTAPPERTR